MSLDMDRVRARLQRVMDETGWKARPLSERAGLGETAVRDIVTGRVKSPKVETLRQLAAILNLPLTYFTDDAAFEDAMRLAVRPGDAASVPPTPPPSTVRDAPEVPIPVRTTMPVSLPVYGTAAGGNGDGAFILSTGDVVDRVRRPASLAENKLAYGLYVEGESMEPQIYAGELLIVDPSKKPRPRDKVVLVISYPDGEDTRSTAYVKELVRICADKVIVRQFNPPKDLEFAKANVASVHRILTTAELFGV